MSTAPTALDEKKLQELEQKFDPEMRFRLAEKSPILRFASRLTSTRPRAFSRSDGEDGLVYLSTSLAGLPRAREVVTEAREALRANEAGPPAAAGEGAGPVTAGETTGPMAG